jgi:HAD superfamily hydrolase (TIGR01509 family)
VSEVNAVDPELVRGVELLSLDAGNTVIFLDHARLARLVSKNGFAVDAAALVRAEGEAKRAAEVGALVDVEWRDRELPGAPAWGRMVATILARAGFPTDRLTDAVSELWQEHVALNLWSLVPEGLGAALARARAKGVRVALVSNSEGMLDRLFAHLGLLEHFDTIVDSAIVGVAKPDPGIFHIAMVRCKANPAATLHVGDIYATDTLGARAAGIRTALVDPFGHYGGLHADVSRVPGATQVANAIADVA